jgi:glycogen debranching enzyme
MALFGRDALITGYQIIILGPELAKNALMALWQGIKRRGGTTSATPSPERFCTSSGSGS